MSAYNLTVTGTDFDEIKTNLKTFLKSNSGLTDVDFEGSGAAVLLDILAYNTFYGNVYLNASVNESSILTAIQRNNVVAHANPLGYIPRSMTAAQVSGTLRVTPTDVPTVSYISVPVNTPFTTKIENKSYRFQNINSALLTWNGTQFVGDVTLYEGTAYTYRFTVDTTNADQKFAIPNADVDTSLLVVNVLRDNTYTTYYPSDTVINVSSTDTVYWTRENDDGLIELKFGDGVIGAALAHNDVVILSYYVSHGATPNGATAFETQVSLGGYSDVTFTASGSAAGGAIREDIESIRTNAPKNFETQDRAVTWSDYETLLMKNFGTLGAVSVWGGEENDPPYYGRVFIAGKPLEGEYLTTTEKSTISAFLKTKNMGNVVPMYVDPEYTYLKIITDVKFQYNKSPLSISEVQTQVSETIMNFADQKLQKFNTAFRYSNLVTTIDECAIGIKSSDTEVRLVKRQQPTIGSLERMTVDFGAVLEVQSIESTGFTSTLDTGTLYLYTSTVQDSAGQYPVYYYKMVGGTRTNYATKLGYVSYANGIIYLNAMVFSSLVNSIISFEAHPVEYNYTPSKNTIITVDSSDVTVTVTAEA
jgi:hypothetical protein